MNLALAFITAAQVSGYTPPEYAFSIQCEISLTGQVHRTMYTQANPSQESNQQIGKREMKWIHHLVNQSSRGKLETRQGPCDAGTFKVIAYPTELPLPIYDANDCGMITVNHSKAAQKLLAIVRKKCDLK